MIESNPFNGVGMLRRFVDLHGRPPPRLRAAARAAHAPMPRKRRTAAATLASVNRGTF